MIPGVIWQQMGRTIWGGRWYWVEKVVRTALKMWGSEVWLAARRGELWFTCEPVVAVIRSPLMPCCWSSDYSQDIMVLSDVWIWGSSYLGGPLSLVIAQLKGQLSLWEVSKFVLLSTFPFELSSLVLVCKGPSKKDLSVVPVEWLGAV